MSAYTIQLDKSNNFECNIKVQGASVKKTKVNLVLECNDFSLKFKGGIDENGKVVIPVAKLKGILEENEKGNLYLEVIADDTYFTPYQTEYITEVSRKVEVISVHGKQSLIENREEIVESKPKIIVTDIKETVNLKEVIHHTKNIVQNIKNNNLSLFKADDKNKAVKIIKSYLTENKLSGEINIKIMESLYKIVSSVK